MGIIINVRRLVKSMEKKDESLEKRVRNKILIATLVGIPALAITITGTLFNIEKYRKEENMKNIKPPAIIQPANPDYSSQMSDIYAPDVISQTD
jgi:hypothetical protein